MICGSGGPKSRLAKAARAEPSGQMRDEKLHAVAARSTCGSHNVQNTSASDHFWKLRCRKSARCFGAKHISKSKCTNTPCSDHFWTFRCRLVWQVQEILHIVKSEQNVKFLKKTLEEDLERCISRGRRSTRDMLTSGLLRWFCVTGAALRMTWHHFCVASTALYTDGVAKFQTHWYGPSALHSTSICLKKYRRMLRFWCCQLRKLRKSRRIASFSNLQKDR